MSAIADTKKNPVRALGVKKGDRVLLPGTVPAEIAEALACAGAVLSTEADDCPADSQDLILLFGTLHETANAEDVSEADLIKSLLPLLKAGGRLVTACDNASGLHYLSGSQLEESGEFFSGFDGRIPHTETMYFYRTFTGLFSDLPNTETEYYYPYPDFRTPLFIYSDDRLPAEGELLHYEINFHREAFSFFDDAAAFDTVIRNGLFREYANSFVAVTRKAGAAKAAEKVIYRKYPESRDLPFRMETDIVSAPAGKYILKKPLTTEASAHAEAILSLTEKLSARYQGLPETEISLPVSQAGGLRYAFASGRSLKEILTELAEKRAFEAMGPYLDRYAATIFYGAEEAEFVPDEEYRKIFGDAAVRGKTAVASITDLDPIFDNIFVDGNRWTLIDCEWNFDFPLPQKFLLYRAVRYFTSPAADPDLWHFLLDRFALSAEEAEVFSAMEDAFQAYVSGGKPTFREECRDSVRPVIPLSEVRKAFFDEENWLSCYDYGTGFQEKNSGGFRVAAGPKKQVTVPFDGRFFGIRLLPPADTKEIIFENNNDLPEGVTFWTSGNMSENGRISFAERPQLVFKSQGFRGSFTADFFFPETAGRAAAAPVETVPAPASEKKATSYVPAAAPADSALLRLRHLAGRAYHRLKGDDLAGRFGEAGLQAAEAYDRRHPGRIWPAGDTSDYGSYIRAVEPGLRTQGEVPEDIRFSVVVPVYNCRPNELMECILSVQAQLYQNYELIMVDDCSTDPQMRNILTAMSGDPRIRVHFREENGRISRATNDGIEMAEGDYIAFLDCDDVLSPYALREFAAYLNAHPETDFLYSDEDKLAPDGLTRKDPFFKPDWSPDLYWAMNYTNHLSIYRASIVKEIGGLRPAFDGAQDYDMTMRFLEHTDESRIGHIPLVLYHWRETVGSTAAELHAKPYVFEAAKKLKEEALARRGISGHVDFSEEVCQYRVLYDPSPDDMVSIIIPSKDNPWILFRCIDSVLALEDGVQKEIIVVDNGSNEENRQRISSYAAEKGFRYIYEKAEFNFSKMVNTGARAANGNYILFLNDDTEVKEKDSIRIMLGQAGQAHTGAVGAKLLYPEGDRIQHVGVLNLPEGPSHAFLKEDDTTICLNNRNRVTYNYLAVTAACLMISKEKYEEVGGFAEELRVAYNDVDFCYKLAEKGYYNVVRNDAVFLHYESLSRGLDTEDTEKTRRLTREREELYRRHPAFAHGDPFYNENLWSVLFLISLNEVKPTQRQLPDFAPALKEDRFDLTVDVFRRITQSGVLEICGWYETGAGKADNGRTAYIVLKNGDRKLFYETEKIKRQDICERRQATGQTGKRIEILTTGFYARIPEPPAGFWELGVAISDGNGYRVTYPGKATTI